MGRGDADLGRRVVEDCDQFIPLLSREFGRSPRAICVVDDLLKRFRFQSFKSVEPVVNRGPRDAVPLGEVG